MKFYNLTRRDMSKGVLVFFWQFQVAKSRKRREGMVVGGECEVSDGMGEK